MKMFIKIERAILVIISALYLTNSASGQVAISSGGGWNAFDAVDLSTLVRDKDNQEPICGASVILQADTIITHFSISRENGQVVISNVPKGKYQLKVEMLGYIPYMKELTVMKTSDIPEYVDLSVDTHLLEAAKITELATPVYQIRDTLVYNAVSVRVGNNASLEDLLKKMPGMEIADGNVFVNGIPVNTITVDGKTFFFNDPSIALNNLPAKIVEKIRVFDKVAQNEGSLKTSLGKKDERVLDVELKEEFKTGAFGNAVLNGGFGTSSSANEVKMETKALYDTRLVISSYNEYDQVVALATADNLSPANSWNGKLAMNVNTSRIANSDNTLAIIASYDKETEDRLISSTYFAQGTDYLQASECVSGQTGTAKVDVNLETKIKGDWGITITPVFNYTNSNYNQETNKRLYSDGSDIISHLAQSGRTSSVSGGLSIRGGNGYLKRDGRSLRFKVSGNGCLLDGNKVEVSSYSLDYITAKKNITATASVIYSEPISDNFSLNFAGDFSYSISNNIITATNSGTNIIVGSFSSNSFVKNINCAEALFATWKRKLFSMSLGAQIRQDMSENTWEASGPNKKRLYTVSPFINIESFDGSKQLYLSSKSVAAQDIKILPSMSRTGSAERLIGNPYLKPSTYFSVTANFYKTRQIQVMCEVRLDRNPIVDANWISSEGIRYSFPVNSTCPQIAISPFVNYYLYFSKDKSCYLYFNINGILRFERGYQATRGPVINDDKFIFADFIDNYWGDNNGDIFYDGRSGFRESSTFSCNLNGRINFVHRSKTMTTTFHFSPMYYVSKYSLVPEAGEQLWKIALGPSVDMRLPKDFALTSELEYILYKGYGKGLDRGLWNLSFELSKEIGTIALSLKCNDVLNQSVRISHFASSEYVQNAMQNCLGRTVSVSFGYLFGKGSAERQRSSSKFVQNVTR